MSMLMACILLGRTYSVKARGGLDCCSIVATTLLFFNAAAGSAFRFTTGGTESLTSPADVFKSAIALGGWMLSSLRAFSIL